MFLNSIHCDRGRCEFISLLIYLISMHLWVRGHRVALLVTFLSLSKAYQIFRLDEICTSIIPHTVYSLSCTLDSVALINTILWTFNLFEQLNSCLLVCIYRAGGLLYQRYKGIEISLSFNNYRCCTTPLQYCNPALSLEHFITIN